MFKRIRSYLPKSCIHCKKEYVPQGPRQKLCANCINKRDSSYRYPDDATMTCSRCLKEKSIFEFQRRWKGKNQRHGECWDCKKELRRLWIAGLGENPSVKWGRNNPEIRQKAQDRYYAKKHGLSLERYEAMRDAQSGMCAICDKPNNVRGKRRLVFDHDHDTGKFRGLLCSNCNLMLGSALDNPEILVEASKYLGYAQYAETFDPSGLGC